MLEKIGTYKKQPQGFKAFVPNRFPPDEGFSLSRAVQNKASRAILLLGKLDGITQLLPDVEFFLLMYIRKDASSSSQIEGTQATMIDAIEAESKISNQYPDDVSDILHYIKALNYGSKALKKVPLSLRTIKEIHKELMSGARSSHYADPGNFRKSQNWIGGTAPDNASYVPPPVHEMERSLHELESFIHADDGLLPTIKAGLIHAQFEAIHPFLDGNGRTGRLLITLYLEFNNLLERPVLFLSSYFKRHQKIYYQRLNGYHEGKVNEWLNFFLDGVIETAEEAVETARQITELREQDLSKVQSLGKTAASSTTKILPLLFQNPIVNVATIKDWTGFTRQGAQKMVDRLTELGILELKDETKQYGRSYIYRRYTDIFEDK